MSLTIYWPDADPGCGPATSVHLEEGPDAVVIALPSTDQELDGACAASARTRRTTLDLAAPVGDRALLVPLG
jgi:hypothetical protein